MRHFGHWLEAGYTPVVSVCKRPRNKQLRAKAAEKYSSCSGCSTLLGDNKTKNLLETLRTTLCCLLANDATKRRQAFLKLCAQLFAACWPMTNIAAFWSLARSRVHSSCVCMQETTQQTTACKSCREVLIMLRMQHPSWRQQDEKPS